MKSNNKKLIRVSLALAISCISFFNSLKTEPQPSCLRKTTKTAAMFAGAGAGGILSTAFASASLLLAPGIPPTAVILFSAAAFPIGSALGIGAAAWGYDACCKRRVKEKNL